MKRIDNISDLTAEHWIIIRLTIKLGKANRGSNDFGRAVGYLAERIEEYIVAKAVNAIRKDQGLSPVTEALSETKFRFIG